MISDSLKYLLNVPAWFSLFSSAFTGTLVHMISRGLALSALLLCFAQSGYAGLAHDSELSWVTAESAHFRIHYHDDEKLLADKALAVAESVYARLTPVLEWLPLEKTEIVLSDETDASNGFATPFPSNRITLFASRPSSVNSLEDHAGWLETVILHEFVHTLHLDKARGSPQEFRSVLGRFFLLFPNVFMPPWMHEGLATYFETDKELGIGRGQSSYFAMMMRQEVQGGVKPVNQINQPIVSWPLLTSRYLYGVYFHQFLVETYGAEVIPALVQSYSDHLMPFRINDLYEDVLAKNLTQIWAEYQGYLERKFQPQITKLQQTGADDGQRLTNSGDFKRSLQATADGRLFFVRDHLQTGSKVMLIDQQGQAEEFAETNIGARLDWHESAGLLLAQPDRCNNANSYYDLYQLDGKTGKQTRLTSCQRYIMAAWSADGKAIAAVKNYRGQHALHRLNPDGVLQEVLWQGADEQTISSLDWSVDGRSLAVSMWRKGSGWNIEEFDLTTKQWRQRTHNSRVKTDVSYVGKSRDLLFSMEQEGIYNAFILPEKGGELIRLSHVPGGLFSPWLNQEGQLLSINYNAAGFDVYKLHHVQSSSTPLSQSGREKLESQIDPLAVEISEAVPYSPWDSLQPTSWFPSFMFSNQGMELGASMFGTDVLNRHSFTLFAGYQEVTRSPVFALDYTYDRWLPLLKLYAQQLELPSFDNQGGLIALTRNQRLDSELIFPWLSAKERWSGHIGFTYQQEKLSWLAPNYYAVSSGYRDTLAGLAVVYDARESYARSVSSVSEGRLWSLVTESGAGLGGDYRGAATTLSGREYIDLSIEQVLALLLDVAKGSATSRPFQLGGNKWNSILPNVFSPLTASAAFNRRSYALRGYGQGEAELTGQDMALLSAEYRFPIARIERGIMAPPIGIDQIFGQLFMDAGRAGDSLSKGKTYVGTGVELGVDFIAFYTVPLRLQLGYARGLDPTIGGKQVYLRLGNSF